MRAGTAVRVAEFNLTLCVILKCWWTWWVLEPGRQGKTEVSGEKFAPVLHGLQCEECGSWSQSGYSKVLDGSTLTLHVKVSSKNIAWHLWLSLSCCGRFLSAGCGAVFLRTSRRTAVPSTGTSACSSLYCPPRCSVLIHQDPTQCIAFPPPLACVHSVISAPS